MHVNNPCINIYHLLFVSCKFIRLYYFYFILYYFLVQRHFNILYESQWQCDVKTTKVRWTFYFTDLRKLYDFEYRLHADVYDFKFTDVNWMWILNLRIKDICCFKVYWYESNADNATYIYFNSLVLVKNSVHKFIKTISIFKIYSRPKN